MERRNYWRTECYSSEGVLEVTRWGWVEGRSEVSVEATQRYIHAAASPACPCVSVCVAGVKSESGAGTRKVGVALSVQGRGGGGD